MAAIATSPPRVRFQSVRAYRADGAESWRSNASAPLRQPEVINNHEPDQGEDGPVKMGSLQHAKLFISVVVQFLHLLFFTSPTLLFLTGDRASGRSRQVLRRDLGRRSGASKLRCVDAVSGPNLSSLDGADQFATHWRRRLSLCRRLFTRARWSALSGCRRCK
jgi:hypothetical protein